MKTLSAVVACGVLSVPAFAQTPAAAPANPITMSVGGQFGMIKGYLTKAAEQVPENLYAFKATPEVRSLGQLFGHVADANYAMCSAAIGEKNPGLNIEKTKTAKADLQKALGESFAYCEKAVAATTDANGGTLRELFGMKMAQVAWLSFAVAHDYEHYGNIVTYLRLNKMVPPSSQGRGM
jgi:uncharacterized damage-inducible protein DinB